MDRLITPGADVRIERENDGKGVPRRWRLIVNGRREYQGCMPVLVNGVEPFGAGRWECSPAAWLDMPGATAAAYIQRWQSDAGPLVVRTEDVSEAAWRQILEWAAAYVDNETCLPETPRDKMTAEEQAGYDELQRRGLLMASA
jgi:hypothetical protein